MSKLLPMSLPLLFVASAAYAAVSSGDPQTGVGLSAPMEAQSADAPSPCGGCAGHDCAHCPMAQAAAAQERVEPKPPCGD
jgi:hypothetical protein